MKADCKSLHEESLNRQNSMMIDANCLFESVEDRWARHCVAPLCICVRNNKILTVGYGLCLETCTDNNDSKLFPHFLYVI